MQITRLLRNTLLGVGATLAFAVAPATASDDALRDTVYNDALPMTERVDAMRELTGLGKPGNDTRKICIWDIVCLLYTSPSPRDKRQSRMPSSA